MLLVVVYVVASIYFIKFRSVVCILSQSSIVFFKEVFGSFLNSTYLVLFLLKLM